MSKVANTHDGSQNPWRPLRLPLFRNLLIADWAEHLRQHDRFTVADRSVEDQVFRYALSPVRIRHFIFARRPGQG
ncbi:MAG: MFS transporter [Candidatus Acidiferrales bacterium]